MSPYRRPWFQMLLWCAGALGIRLAHLSFVADSPLTLVPTSDEFEHWRLALHLASGDWLGAEWGAYHRPQLFAYVLAVMIRLTGGDLYLIHLLVALLDSIGVGLGWRVCRLVFPRRAAWWCGLALATYWPFVHFSGTFYMESFALFVQAGFLLALIAAVRQLVRSPRKTDGASTEGDDGNNETTGDADALTAPRRRAKPVIPAPLFWSGALAGLMLLTRPTVSITLPFVLGMLVVSARLGGRSWRFALLAPAVFFAMTLLVLLPNAARNRIVSGQWIWYSSNGALNFYFGNNDKNISWITRSPGLEWTLFIETPAVEEGIGADRARRIAYWRRESLDYLRRNPGHFLAGLYDKSLLVWNARSVHCTNNFEELGRLSPVQRLLPGFGFWGAAGLVGLLLTGIRLARAAHRRWRGDACEAWAWHRYAGQAMLLGYVLLYQFGVALFLAVERHRLPAVAVLLLFSGVLIAEGITPRRRRRLGMAAAGAGAWLAAALFTAIPLTGPDLLQHERYWTRMNLGVATKTLARDMREKEAWLDEARGHFLEAHALLPSRIEPPRQLALLAEQRERPAEALAHQRRLVRLLDRDYPRYRQLRAEHTAHELLLCLKANRVGEAVVSGERLARLAPTNADARHLYGVALMAADRTEEAGEEFRRTLALDPGHQAARANLERLDANAAATETPAATR